MANEPEYEIEWEFGSLAVFTLMVIAVVAVAEIFLPAVGISTPNSEGAEGP